MATKFTNEQKKTKAGIKKVKDKTTNTLRDAVNDKALKPAPSISKTIKKKEELKQASNALEPVENPGGIKDSDKMSNKQLGKIKNRFLELKVKLDTVQQINQKQAQIIMGEIKTVQKKPEYREI